MLSQAVGGENMIRLHFNWVNNQDGTLTDNYLWFYIKNIGVVFLLLIPAFLHADKKQRWFYGGGLALLVLAEFVVFQPNLYDNNKLLFVWHLLGCILVAGFAADVLAALRSPALRYTAGAVLCLLAMAGSADLRPGTGEQLRAVDRRRCGSGPVCGGGNRPGCAVSHLPQPSPAEASLAGRQVVCGSDIYLYYHGVDYTNQRNAVQALYETPDAVTLDAWGIDYAVFDGSVSAQYHADEEWYAARYPLCYRNDSYRVYQIR